MGELTERLDGADTKIKLAMAEQKAEILEDIQKAVKEPNEKIEKLETRFWKGIATILGLGFLSSLVFILGIYQIWETRGDTIEHLEAELIELQEFHTSVAERAEVRRKAKKAKKDKWFWE